MVAMRFPVARAREASWAWAAVVLRHLVEAALQGPGHRSTQPAEVELPEARAAALGGLPALWQALPAFRVEQQERFRAVVLD